MLTCLCLFLVSSPKSLCRWCIGLDKLCITCGARVEGLVYKLNLCINQLRVFVPRVRDFIEALLCSLAGSSWISELSFKVSRFKVCPSVLKPGINHPPWLRASMCYEPLQMVTSLSVYHDCKNYISHHPLRHCQHGACLPDKRRICLTVKTFWENCQCAWVLTAVYNRYMVTETTAEALWLEY